MLAFIGFSKKSDGNVIRYGDKKAANCKTGAIRIEERGKGNISASHFRLFPRSQKEGSLSALP